MAQPRRVAVIGAGIAGMAATKACLEEGLLPTCFEQHGDIGGTWYYTEQERPNQTAPSYRNLSMNVSKEMVTFTDFPVRGECPQFMVTKRFHDYLYDYAKHFDLLRHVRLNQTVTCIRPTEDYSSTGQWEVHVKSRDGDVEEQHVFDAVCLCSGSLRTPSIPQIPGLEDFKGTVMHSMQYRRPDVFEDKNVLVVGKQFSAVDQACDISKQAGQVYLSVGDGTNIIARPCTLPPGFTRWKTRERLGDMFHKMARTHFDHDKHGIGDGGNPYLDGTIALCDLIVPCLETGTIVIAPRVTGFTEKSVLYADGSSQEIDAVLFATGYKPCFDFVECDDIKGDSYNEYNLYKEVFPTSCQHPTLAVISVPPTFGPYPFLVDNASRWAARVFARKHHLPDKATMERHLRQKQKFYRENCEGRVKTAAFEMADVIADELGVKPDIGRILFKSPSLAYKIFFGPVLPLHYRLVGPGACERCWEDSHAYYDRLYPNDIAKKISLLCTGMLGILAAGLAYPIMKQFGDWQVLASWLSGEPKY